MPRACQRPGRAPSACLALSTKLPRDRSAISVVPLEKNSQPMKPSALLGSYRHAEILGHPSGTRLVPQAKCGVCRAGKNHPPIIGQQPRRQSNGVLPTEIITLLPSFAVNGVAKPVSVGHTEGGTSWQQATRTAIAVWSKIRNVWSAAVLQAKNEDRVMVCANVSGLCWSSDLLA